MLKNTMGLGLLLFVVTPVTSVAEDLFVLKPVVPSVYLALAKAAPVTNSNAVVVILDDGVLVVDSHSKPSAARALVAQIHGITDKPVRYVVNSHFHWDHAQGNRAYVGAWPADAEILSSEATRFNLEHIGIARIRADAALLPGTLDQLRQRLAATSEQASHARLAEEIADTEAYLQEIRSLELALPTLSFDRSLTLRRGQQTVHLLFLGRGHTDGDVVVYLPRERVIATGDLVHAYAPFMQDSYPYDWIRTLGDLEKLDFDVVLSGHGDVLHGKGQITLWQEYIEDLMREVEQSVARGRDKGETVTEVAPVIRQRFGSRFPQGPLEDCLVPSIEKAWTIVAMPVK
jgi:glyoxylase-like metal-dependent hydrolase (beta-lactamase superfamily II)